VLIHSALFRNDYMFDIQKTVCRVTKADFTSLKRYILFIFRENYASNIAASILIIFTTYKLKLECM